MISLRRKPLYMCITICTACMSATDSLNRHFEQTLCPHAFSPDVLVHDVSPDAGSPTSPCSEAAGSSSSGCSHATALNNELEADEEDDGGGGGEEGRRSATPGPGPTPPPEPGPPAWGDTGQHRPERRRRKLPEIPKNKKCSVGQMLDAIHAYWKEGGIGGVRGGGSCKPPCRQSALSYQATQPPALMAMVQPSLADELGDAFAGGGGGRPETLQFALGACSRPLIVLKCHSYLRDEDSSPDSEYFHSTDVDSGNSTAHSPDGPKSMSPQLTMNVPYRSVSGSPSPVSPCSTVSVPYTQLELLEATHRGLHKFIPRHHDEIEVEIGDPIYVQKEADDLWCEGEPGSIPGGIDPIFPYVVIVPDDARWSVISRFPRPCILELFHVHLASPSSALKTSMLRAAQVSPLYSRIGEISHGATEAIREQAEYLDIPAAIGERTEEFGGPRAIGEAAEEFNVPVSLFVGKPAEQLEGSVGLDLHLTLDEWTMSRSEVALTNRTVSSQTDDKHQWPPEALPAPLMKRGLIFFLGNTNIGGVNLRSGVRGIFPSAYVVDMDYSDFDPSTPKVKRERYLLGYLGSVETKYHKGNKVLCQAVRKIVGPSGVPKQKPHSCILEVSDQGLRMVDKRKPSPRDVPCHDYFYSLKNVSFCAFHPRDHRYLGFITKHPQFQRFACHVFMGCESTRPVAEAIG
ncbi:hypothetical protein PR048_021445 [Dryococelus australis]|uniref:PID domain-containing protein n=1 Tax=Dryococelus australis TaxID=614101 RepID=A0ABQ9GY95_9NEOP|nr:hypothetical protein PR048_021445 [Dryococelus australis]